MHERPNGCDQSPGNRAVEATDSVKLWWSWPVEEAAWDLSVSSERREGACVFVLLHTPVLVCLGEVRSTDVVPSKLSSWESLSSVHWQPVGASGNSICLFK